MKIVRFLRRLLLTLLILSAMIVALTFIFYKPIVKKIIPVAEERLLSSYPDISFEFSDLDFDNRDNFSLFDIKVTYKEQEVAYISTVNLKVTVADLIRTLIYRNSLSFQCDINNIDIVLDKDFIGYLSSLSSDELIIFDKFEKASIDEFNISLVIDGSNVEVKNASLENLSIDQFIFNNSVSIDISQDVVNYSLSVDNQVSLSGYYNTINSSIVAAVRFFDVKISDYLQYIPSLYENSVIQKLPNDFALSGVISVDGTFVDGKLLCSYAVNIDGSSFDSSVEFKCLRSESQIDFEYLNIGALNYQVKFNGLYDFKNTAPKGDLYLYSTKNSEILASVIIGSSIEDKNYTFDLSLVKNPEYTLKGFIDNSSDSVITANAYLSTPYQNTDCYVEVERDFSSINVVLDYFTCRIDFDNEIATIFAQSDNFGLKISDNYSVRTDFVLNGSYNLLTGQYVYTVNRGVAKISDKLKYEFDLKINNQGITLSNICKTINGAEEKYSGVVNYNFGSSFTIDTMNTVSGNYVVGSYANDNFYLDLSHKILDLSLSLTGNLEDGLYALCRYKNLSFEAHYADKYITLFNSEGKIGSFNVTNIDFIIDIASKQIYGSANLTNILHNMDGDVVQGCRVEIEAKLDSLVVGALSIAGVEGQADFNVSVKNAYLGDGFKIKDHSFKVSLDKKIIKLSGEYVNGYYDYLNSQIDLSINKDLLIGFNVKGSFANDSLDLQVSDVYFPLGLMNQFINFPAFRAEDGILYGDVLVVGKKTDPSFYGMMYAQTFDLSLLWAPQQIISINSSVITINDHSISIPLIPVTGCKTDSPRRFDAMFKVDLELKNLGIESVELLLDSEVEPIDIWVPINYGTGAVSIRGDMTGPLVFWYRNNESGIDSKWHADNFSISFEMPDFTPSWIYNLPVLISANIELTTGKNVEFCYPNKENAFIDITLEENQFIKLDYDDTDKTAVAVGNLKIKSGRIYYFNNDFKITEGMLNLSQPLDGSKTIDLSIDLTAKLKEYDSNGDKVDIYLILSGATLDNINPRFESSSGLSENEIIQILRQAVLPAYGEVFTLSNIANFAFMATDAIRTLGLLDVDDSYSLTSVIRDSLNLDIFAARAPILENILIQSLPGVNGNSDNLIANYLNGTRIYAGKYIGNVFAMVTATLKSVNSDFTSDKITDNMKLDFEFSVDWENPLGSFGIFSQPDELSAIGILDTIGFSFSKRINL